MFKLNDRFSYTYSGKEYFGTVSRKVTNQSNIYVKWDNVGCGLSSGPYYSNNLHKIESTIKEFLETSKQLKKEIEEINNKIKFLKENKIEEFDPMQYKAWLTLTILESTDDKIEKARLIADLINN